MEPGTLPTPTEFPPVTPSPYLPISPSPSPLLRVGLDAANRPWAYPDGKGALTGLDVDLLAALAGEMGVRLEYVNVAPHLLLTGLAEKRFDLAANGLVVTPERAKQAAFSQPYLTLGQIVAVRADETTINGPAGLAGQRVGAQLGSLALAEARQIAGAIVLPADDLAIALAALSRGELQAVIADQILAADYLRAHPEAKLRLAGQPFAGEPVALAVRKDNAALLDQINAALDRLRQKGLLAQIERRWR